MRLALRPAAALAAIFALLDACATTDTSANTATESPPPRRHRRRRHLDANGAPIETAVTDSSGTPSGAPTEGMPTEATPGTDTAAVSGSPSDAPASTATFGSPVVHATSDLEVTPHWIVEDGRGRLACEGAERRPVPPPTPQCPQEPSNAAVVRAFIPVERDVLACDPPANTNGRLPMHVTFGAAGYPLEVSFPGVRVTRRIANCMGRALCSAHVPNFRSAEATVDYEYVVLVPASE